MSIRATKERIDRRFDRIDTHVNNYAGVLAGRDRIEKLKKLCLGEYELVNVDVGDLGEIEKVYLKPQLAIVFDKNSYNSVRVYTADGSYFLCSAGNAEWGARSFNMAKFGEFIGIIIESFINGEYHPIMQKADDYFLAHLLVANDSIFGKDLKRRLLTAK